MPNIQITPEELGMAPEPVASTLRERSPIEQSIAANAFGAAGLAAMVEAPTVVGKAIGFGMLAADVIKQVDLMGFETGIPAMRQRLSELGQSLKDKATGKFDFVSKLRRGTGEQLQGAEVPEYRRKFNHLIGGMALVETGMELSLLQSHNTGFQAMGAAMTAVGTAKVGIGSFSK